MSLIDEILLGLIGFYKKRKPKDRRKLNKQEIGLLGTGRLVFFLAHGKAGCVLFLYTIKEVSNFGFDRCE